MINMNDLSRQYNRLRMDINKNIENVLEHGKYIMGPEVTELESKLAQYADVNYVVTCSSGTDALLMILMAFEVGQGDAVFTTPFTFIATSEVISFLGATPVFVDIDTDTYNIKPELLEKAIKKTLEEGKLKPKAVIPVDIFGLPADYDSIEEITNKYGIRVLEDAAQSFGSTYKGKRAGSFGNAAATSFFPAKPLGCYGDGGAVFTKDTELYEKLKSLRVHGQGMDKYDNIRIGVNGRLDTIQAAVLLAKLSVFDEEIELRNKIAKKYFEELKDIVKIPKVPKDCKSAWAQYSVLAKDPETRKLYIDVLKEVGVKTAIYYKKPLHLQLVYKDLGYKKGDFEACEDISNRIFSLPMHPYLKEEEIEVIINTLQCLNV